MNLYNKKRLKSIASDASGQTFLEFILLFLIMIGFSFLLLNLVGTGISDRWKNYVKVIASPNSQSIDFN